jgi:transcriptional regulator with XRE-family HTH domain
MARRGPQARKLLADNVRILRALRRISQDEVAAEAGLTQSLISRIELETANPTLKSLEGIAQAFNVEMADLFARERQK